MSFTAAPVVASTSTSVDVVNSPYTASRLNEGQIEFTSTGGNIVIDALAPTVQGVYVASTSWSASFLTELQDNGLGSSTLGYALNTGASQLSTLPWNNINKISIAFSEDVVVSQASLALNGINIGTYSVTGFSYDAINHVGTWTLGQTIAKDKLLVSINSNILTDIAGNFLDGEWTNGTSTTSGNGAAGGNFGFRFNALPGDADRSNIVLSNDVNAIRVNQFANTSSANYSVYQDIDGSGLILSNDVNAARVLQFTSLPAGEPSGGAFTVTSNLMVSSSDTFITAPSSLLLATPTGPTTSTATVTTVQLAPTPVTEVTSAKKSNDAQETKSNQISTGGKKSAGQKDKHDPLALN
jgi:hypothetical protein